MRINKLLSNYGICSRKEANRIIEQNRIIVNGKLCIPGQWVEESDEILLDNKRIKPKKKVYILLNKPVGITCTSSKDIKANIIDFVNYRDYIFPVGRLDKKSEGLIILTNDGELSNKILESENMHEKEYVVKVDKPFDDEFIENMSKGVQLKGVKTRTCIVRRIDECTFKIILTQGLNRQIRKMTRAFGYTVVKLKRIRIMNLKIDGIDIGSFRHFTEDELNNIRVMVMK
ncbi:pseudouridine synthase [Clostridium novyi]|uniref:Pseudouridine synthase n=1 Tax=Clostridium novyi (strain NT) TaxID=386415 RepID=A0PYR9_CLONN|nr:pseudouridine synthase [Clostridium novyi]ABK62160.1 RNA pseudouridylate synthase family protein [Clostridium novyi NT]KEH86789.1 pseudouridine synthase [Clostridium novyi A str. NCTC 538]KEH90531.1 pseudouridine synthase [Clostridium novyi A str. BKT29909]